MSGYQRMLVPVDGSPTSNAGIDEAIRLAKLTDGRIRLVHVLDGNLFGIGCETYVGDVLGMLSEAGAQILTEHPDGSLAGIDDVAWLAIAMTFVYSALGYAIERRVRARIAGSARHTPMSQGSCR